MPRQRRLWEPGDLLGIVVRAHEGRPIFATDEDREFVLARLGRLFVPAAVDLIAWAVLLNHLHLMIRVTALSPETLFRRFCTAIARRERRRRGDHGAVLQGRYWSRRCTDEGSVISLLTYVLGNPVHHGVVPSAEALESYPWSAYGAVLGLRGPGPAAAAATLALLAPDPLVARERLRRAMEVRVADWRAQRAGIDVCDEPGCRGAPDGCELVHARLPRRARSGAAPPEAVAAGSDAAWQPRGVSTVHDERLDRRARLRARGWTLADLVRAACARCGADTRVVLAGGRRPAACSARAVIAHVACDGVGLPAAEVAAHLGVSDAAVSVGRRRGELLLAAHGWRVDDLLP